METFSHRKSPRRAGFGSAGDFGRLCLYGGLVVGAGFFAAYCAMADSGLPASGAPGAAETVSAVLTRIHQADLREIREAELARERGSSVLVRAFADRLVRDHRRFESLLAAATDVPSGAAFHAPGPDPDPAPGRAALGTLSGRAFDQEFTSRAEEDHRREEAALAAASARLPAGSATRALLEKIVPLLREHREVARNIEPWL